MPPEISIYPALKALAPDLALGCLSANVRVEKHNEALWHEIDQARTGLSTGCSAPASSFSDIAAPKVSKPRW